MNTEKTSSDPVDSQTGPSVAVQASVNLSAPTLPKGVTPTITPVGDEKGVTPTITVVGDRVTPTITATGDEKVANNKPQDKSGVSTPAAIMQVG